MDKLNICFTSEDFYPSFIGGQGIYGLHLITQLSKMSHRLTILAEDKKGRRQFWQNKKNIQLILIPYCYGNQLILALLEYLFFTFKLSKENFDLLHANQLSGLFFILFKPANIKKIVVSVHNTYFDMYQTESSILKKIAYLPLIFLEKLVYQKADGLLFNSPVEEKDLLAYFAIKHKPVRSVYLGSQQKYFTHQQKKKTSLAIRKKLGLHKNAKIVLYVGRLVKRKKVDTFLKAIRLINNKLNSCHQIPNQQIIGLIIGQGPQRKNLEKIAPPNVKFLGFVEETRPYFLAADLFVTISVAEGGIALSVLEAASYGLPLILSPSCAGCPIIQEGKNGYIVDPDDALELAEKILLALKNAIRFSRFSKKLSCFFSWQRHAQETCIFYHQLITPTK